MSRPQTLSAVAVAVAEASSAIASDTSCTARPARSEASPRKRRGKFRRLAYTADYNLNFPPDLVLGFLRPV